MNNMIDYGKLRYMSNAWCIPDFNTAWNLKKKNDFISCCEEENAVHVVELHKEAYICILRNKQTKQYRRITLKPVWDY